MFNRIGFNCSLAPSRYKKWRHFDQFKPKKDLSSVHNKLFERVYDFLPGKCFDINLIFDIPTDKNNIILAGHGTYTFARILRNSSTGRVVDCIGLSTLTGAVTTWKNVNNKAIRK